MMVKFLQSKPFSFIVFSWRFCGKYPHWLNRVTSRLVGSVRFFISDISFWVMGCWLLHWLASALLGFISVVFVSSICRRLCWRWALQSDFSAFEKNSILLLNIFVISWFAFWVLTDFVYLHSVARVLIFVVLGFIMLIVHCQRIRKL